MESYDNCRLNRKEMLRYYAIGAAASVWIGYLFYHSPLFSLLLTIAVIPGQKQYERYLAEKKKKELSMQFRDLLYSLSGSFSTSRQMKDALRESLDSLCLIYGENAVINKEVSYIVRRMEESKDSEAELLHSFAQRSKDPDVGSFVDVYLICRKTGGNLVRVVAKTTDVLIDKLDIEREIRKLTAQKRYESVVISSIPLLLLSFLQIASPDYLAVLYETLAGRILMTAALFITVASYLWSVKITKIEV